MKTCMNELLLKEIIVKQMRKQTKERQLLSTMIDCDNSMKAIGSRYFVMTDAFKVRLRVQN